MATQKNMVPPVNQADQPKKKPKPDRGLKKSKRKEGLYGYLLVTPALILILVISIWPVIQSFYFSLFDLRLSDPTKSSVHTSYNLNLEEYLNSYPFLINDINKDIAGGGGASGELTQIKHQLNALDQKIKSDPSAKEKYKKVNDLLFAYKQVDSKTALVKISKDTANQYTSTITKINKEIDQINQTSKLKDAKTINGLANGLKNAIISPTFIGLSNYASLLSDGETWLAIMHTTIFTVISVLVELVLGLGIAILINKAFIGRGIVRAAILIPWAVPTVVSAMMWKFMYDGQNGIFAFIFAKIGLIHNMSDLLSSPAGAMFSAIFADVWKTTPYMALLLLAGLQTIPGSLYEAASIDGATKWKQFVTITLPLLKSSILVALLFRTLDAFRVFDLIYVLTGGGPANSTEVISGLAYKVMIGETNFGAGSALSVIVFICVAIISIIYIKFLGRDLLGGEGDAR